MARSTLATQDVVLAGLSSPTYSAANVDGHAIYHYGQPTFLHVKNAGGSACVVTLVTPGKSQGVDVEDPTVTVPATTGDVMIPIRGGVFNQPDGSVNVDFDQVTSVTVAAIRVLDTG